MTQSGTNPLITIVVFAYNQEAFIREAIEGAFAQTYDPLEIILSDDNSSDRTFEIMRQMASSYHGPHSVVLNNNPANLGIAGHLNRLMELARGDLVVVASGDDVSYEHRAATIYEHWVRNPTAVYFHSDFDVLAEGDHHVERVNRKSGQSYRHESRNLRAVIAKCGAGFTGCSEAWHRRLFDEFGPLPCDVFQEDAVIPYRALLVGSIVHVDIPLLNYRWHDQSVWAGIRERSHLTFQERERRLLTIRRQRGAILRSYRRDTLQAQRRHILSSDEAVELLSLIGERELRARLEVDALQAPYFRRVWASVRLFFSRDRQRPPRPLRSRMTTLLFALCPPLERARFERARSRRGSACCD